MTLHRWMLRARVIDLDTQRTAPRVHAHRDVGADMVDDVRNQLGGEELGHLAEPVQVPGDQPLQIELLDAAGKTLKRESGFFWMRGGEQRGCVGCHAGPETAPENAVPMVLLKSTTPADMTGGITHEASGGH